MVPPSRRDGYMRWCRYTRSWTKNTDGCEAHGSGSGNGNHIVLRVSRGAPYYPGYITNVLDGISTTLAGCPWLVFPPHLPCNHITCSNTGSRSNIVQSSKVHSTRPSIITHGINKSKRQCTPVFPPPPPLPPRRACIVSPSVTPTLAQKNIRNNTKTGCPTHIQEGPRRTGRASLLLLVLPKLVRRDAAAKVAVLDRRVRAAAHLGPVPVERHGQGEEVLGE